MKIYFLSPCQCVQGSKGRHWFEPFKKLIHCILGELSLNNLTMSYLSLRFLSFVQYPFHCRRYTLPREDLPTLCLVEPSGHSPCRWGWSPAEGGKRSPGEKKVNTIFWDLKMAVNISLTSFAWGGWRGKCNRFSCDAFAVKILPKQFSFPTQYMGKHRQKSVNAISIF